MNETKTLWARCEALGQFEDYKDEHVDMHFEDERWVIHHDGHVLAFIYEDRVQGSPWLASAILSRIEAHHVAKAIAERSTVTLQNINQKLREALPTVNQEPTPEQCLGMYNWIHENLYNAECHAKDIGFALDISVDTGEILVESEDDERRGFSITNKSFYGYHNHKNNNVQLTFDQACEMVGYIPLPTPERLPDVIYVVEAPKATDPTQAQLRALTQHIDNIDRKGNHENIKVHDLGNISGEFGFRVLFLNGGILSKGIDIATSREDGLLYYRSDLSFQDICERIGFDMKTLKPIQQNAKSADDMVSIPRDQWMDLQSALKTMANVLCFEIKDMEEPRP